MRNYKLKWTDPNGRQAQSVVSYSETSAEDRRAVLLKQGCTDIEIFEVQPGG